MAILDPTIAIDNPADEVVPTRVRALPGGYLSTLFISTFLAALGAYLGYLGYAVAFGSVCGIVTLVLWLTDGIAFDGKRISRRGLVPRLWAKAIGVRDRLKFSDIEQIETTAFRGIKRGHNIYFTYRTTVTGKTARFVFSSGYRGYRELIKSLLSRVNEDVLDNTSIDLRDYLDDKRALRRRAAESEIPSTDVLAASFRDIHLIEREDALPSDDSAEKAMRLRRLGNELRVSGRLVQALEAFRRATVLRPRDARLLFEFAACIRSLAGSERDRKLEHKALAMMRLAERHAGNDHDLLARIGECYFQIGEWRRAGIVFRRAADAFSSSFRTLRGLAELALREGKIAHVIHNFAAANEVASTAALRRWTKTEVDYFSHLNSNEEYMELEISRVNLVETLEKLRRSSFRLTLIGLVLILVGLVFEDYLIANVGWTVAGITMGVWLVVRLVSKMLSPRIPFELMEED